MAVAIAQVLVKLMCQVEPAFRFSALAGVEQLLGRELLRPVHHGCWKLPLGGPEETLHHRRALSQWHKTKSRRDSLPSNTNPPMLQAKGWHTAHNHAISGRVVTLSVAIWAPGLL